ncbi:unnamed protein product, partial [Acanthoscelides obtectus]
AKKSTGTNLIRRDHATWARGQQQSEREKPREGREFGRLQLPKRTKINIWLGRMPPHCRMSGGQDGLGIRILLIFTLLPLQVTTQILNPISSYLLDILNTKWLKQQISLDNETLEPTSQESESEINEVVNVVPSAKSQQAALVAKPHRPTPLPISQQRYRRRQVPTELL